MREGGTLKRTPSLRTSASYPPKGRVTQARESRRRAGNHISDGTAGLIGCCRTGKEPGA